MMIILELNNVPFPRGMFKIVVGKIEVSVILSSISNNSFFLFSWKYVFSSCVNHIINEMNSNILMLIGV